MRWIWENDSPGNRASRKRSTRMPFSSAVTTTVCTLVGSGGASVTIFSGSGGGAGRIARGGRAGEPNVRAGGRPGRALCGRSEAGRSVRSLERSRGGRAETGRSLALLLLPGRLLFAAPALAALALPGRPSKWLLAAPAAFAGRALLAGRSLLGPRLARGFLVRRLMGRSGGWLCLAQKPLRVTVESARSGTRGRASQFGLAAHRARVVRQSAPQNHEGQRSAERRAFIVGAAYTPAHRSTAAAKSPCGAPPRRFWARGPRLRGIGQTRRPVIPAVDRRSPIPPARRGSRQSPDARNGPRPLPDAPPFSRPPADAASRPASRRLMKAPLADGMGVGICSYGNFVKGRT